MELVTGRDQFGRQRNVYHQLRDYFQTAVPIPLKGLVDAGPDRNFIDTLLQSIGVTSRRYRSQPLEEVKRQRTRQ